MNHSIEYYEQQQKHLYQYMVNCTQNVLALEKIFNELIAAIQQFARSFQSIGEQLHKQISSGNESDLIVCCYQQVSNYLLLQSQTWEEVGNKVQTEVCDPFSQFIGNFRQTNRSLNTETKTQLSEILQSREAMVRCQEEYWRLMRTSEMESLQVQQMVDCIERGERTKEDFQKQFNHSFRMQQSAEEAEKDYKKLIDITNNKWKSFQDTWDKIFQNVGLNDQSRNNFSKQTINLLLRLLPQANDMQSYVDRIAEIESSILQDPKIPVKLLIEKRMEQNGIQSKQFQNEEFISFDQWKKINDTQDGFITDTWAIVGDELVEIDKSQIERYVAGLFEPINEKQAELLIKMKQTLQKPQARAFFLDKLQKQHVKIGGYYIQLSEEQFKELENLIKYWINYLDLNEIYDSEEIYKLLSLSIKIIHYVHQTRQNLASTLYDLQLWNKVEKWSQLFFYISGKKIDDKRRKAEVLVKQTQNNIIRKGFNIIGKGIQLFKNLGQQQIQQFEVNEEEVLYLILDEINLFIISLQLKTELAADIILYIAFQQVQIDKDHIVKLLEKQEDRNNVQLKKQLTHGKIILQNKVEKYEAKKYYELENKIIQSINLSLRFFSIKDKPEELLLINSNFNKQLKHKIAKFYICNFQIYSNECFDAHRLQCISNILQLDKNNQNYIQMKIQVGIELDIKQTNIEEVISLDVQRSLSIHKGKISTSILQSLLRTYAYFNQEVSYCQGMNYLAGYWYLNFRDEVITYQAFDKVMQLYFQDIFLNDFIKLKCGFYQFERLLSIFIPDLSQLLKDEKIDASYYSSSWFITLFTNVFQYSIRSSLLNIVWDIFLAEGWKGFFKCSFYILFILQETLMKLEFDEILHFLGQLIKSDLFQIDNEEDLVKHINSYNPNCQINPNYSLKKVILSKFRITNKMLRNLAGEYNCFQLKFNKRLKEYQKQ